MSPALFRRFNAIVVGMGEDHMATARDMERLRSELEMERKRTRAAAAEAAELREQLQSEASPHTHPVPNPRAVWLHPGGWLGQSPAIPGSHPLYWPAHIRRRVACMAAGCDVRCRLRHAPPSVSSEP